MPGLLMLACIAYAAINLGRLLVQEGRLIAQGRVLVHQRQAEDARRQALLAGIRDARSDRGVEHLARTVLALARPDEVQVVYEAGAQPRLARYPVPPTPAPAATPAPFVSSPQPRIMEALREVPSKRTTTGREPDDRTKASP